MTATEILFPEDHARSVVQCACGATMVWRGYAATCDAGWQPSSREVDGKLVRVWRCPDCAPHAVANDVDVATVPPKVPPALLALVLQNTAPGINHRRRDPEAERLLVGLSTTDPAMFAGLMKQILDAIADRRGKVARLWREFAAARGVGAKRRKKAE